MVEKIILKELGPQHWIAYRENDPQGYHHGNSKAEALGYLLIDGGWWNQFEIVESDRYDRLVELIRKT